MQPLKIYLAGDIDRDSPWRCKVVQACKDLPIEFLSPRENTTYTSQSLSKQHKSNPTFVIEDLIKVDRCDMVFAYFRKGRSNLSGTTSEVVWGYKGGKMIYSVFELPEYRYPFPYALSHKVFKKLDEAIEALKDMAVNMLYQPSMPKEG